MRSFRRGWMWTVVAALGVAGCAADAGSARDSDVTEEASQAVAGAEGRDRAHGRRGPPRGPEMLLVAALDELDLTDAQETRIEAALEKVHAERKERRAGGPPGHDALVRGVRAGKIDTAAVLAAAKAEMGAGEHRAAAEGALTTLHATLTKEQRKQLVDAVTQRAAAGPRGPDGEGKGKGPRGEKGERGEPGERGAKDGPPDGARGPGGKRGPLGHMLEGIDLTDAQQAAIEKALADGRSDALDHEAMKKQKEAHHAAMKTRLQAFAADTFDAKAFTAPPEGAAGPGPKHLERMIDGLARVVPILDAAQREKLATRLEQGPPQGGRRGKGGRGGPPAR